MGKPAIIISIVLALFGLALLGRGLSGMYFIDFKLPPCETDNNCDDVCCKFYNVDYGVCDVEDSCKAIYDLTHEEYLRMSNLQMDDGLMAGKFTSIVKAHREAPAQQRHFSSIIVGLVLVLLALISLLIKPEVKKK